MLNALGKIRRNLIICAGVPTLVALTLAALTLAALTLAANGARADSSARSLQKCSSFDWCTYHRTYDGHRYSPLQQIKKSNVHRVRPAWIFQPGNGAAGFQTTPLAIDGFLYFSSNQSRVWKVDGGSGERIWSYTPELDAAVSARTLYPWSRGVAIGDGRVYAGTTGGHVVALSETDGEVLWDNPLIDSTGMTAGFSGAGTFVNGLLVIGHNGGEYPVEGRVFGLVAATGRVKWTFYTTGRNDPAALATWEGNAWKHGGGGSWQPGSVDFKNNLIFLGVGNPNPAHDWGGVDWRTTGARPGLNLYTSSTVALDFDTGKVSWHFQEAPHDPYGYDASAGEYVLLDLDGQELVLHPGKNGFNHVHDRSSGKVINVYKDAKAINWTSGYNILTGEWENMLWPEEGKKTLVCPAVDGGHSWNAGTYSPQTGLFYRIAQEWCMWLTVIREEERLEPFVESLIGAEIENQPPPGPDDPAKPGKDRQHAFLTARDPVSGELAWEKRYDVIPHSSLLSTGGGLLFLGNSEGYVEALDARTGKTLWDFNNGSGHHGGIISYVADGRQFIAVVSGQGSRVGKTIRDIYPERLAMIENSAALVAFSLPFSKK